MPKENKFSGLYEPDKDKCTDASKDNITRFRNAQLKIDRIKDVNETEITEKLIFLAIRYNKTDEKIDTDLDYEDAMATLEEIYNDVDANKMIMALESLAKEYGYVPEMDNEQDLDLEAKYMTSKTIEGLLVDIKKEYDAISDKDEQKEFINKVDGGLTTYLIDKNNERQEVHRGELWRVQLPATVGRESSGYRWIIVISNEKHAIHSDVVNVIYLDGQPPKNKLSHMAITDNDLKVGKLDKKNSRVVITDLYSIDKKKFLEKKGEVTNQFMNKLMQRIAKQLDIK